MKKSTTVLLAIFSLLVFTAGISAQRPKTISRLKTPVLTSEDIAQAGSFAGTLYKNTSLGFTITVPDGWRVLSDEINTATLEAGKADIKNNKSKGFKTAVDRSISNTRILFQAMPLDETNTQATGIFACGVETGATGHTAATYAEMSKKIMLSSSPNSKLAKNTYRKMAGGTVFQAIDIEKATLNGSYFQTIMVTQRKGAMFFFVLTYPDKNGLANLEKAFGTLTFDK